MSDPDAHPLDADRLDEELASWRPPVTPPVTPPFAEVVARRRSLLRRRSALAGTGLAGVALAAVAVVPGLYGGSDRLGELPAPVAAPATATVTVGVEDGPTLYGVRYRETTRSPGDRELDRIQRCLALPGVSGGLRLDSNPAQHRVAVTGVAQRAAFEDCVQALEDVELSVVEQPAAGPAGVTGVRVCLRGTQDCRELDTVYAHSLRRALDRVVPAAARPTSCQQAGPSDQAGSYTVQFTGPTIRPAAQDIARSCGPVAGGSALLLDPAGVEQVRRAYLGEPTLESFLAQCWPIEEAASSDYLRLDQVAAASLAQQRGLEVRVVGSDRECFPITLDLRPNRLNIATEAGVVVAASRA